MKRFVLAVWPAILAVLLTGCGSSSKSSSSASSAPATPTTPTTTTAAPSTRYGGASTPSDPGAAAVLVATKKSKLGTILAGRKGLTLYLFEADSGPRSTCASACAQVWTPLTTTGKPRVGGAAAEANLGTIARDDGTTQVTYKGHPIYYYTKDRDSGDIYGQGIKSFGAAWYVLAPNGNKIDAS